MKKIIIVIITLIILGVGYYAISPLFNEIEVDDALPNDIIQEMPSGVEDLTDEQKQEFDKEMEEMKDMEVSDMDEEVPESLPEEITLFPVMGTKGHPASGYVRILKTETGSIVRYERFETINGPNLRVYLAKDLEASEFVDLGEIKGTKGNINYPVPEDVNIYDYKYVMYWCVPFSVLFNYAEIN